MYNILHQVFEDALNDCGAVRLDGDDYRAVICFGIKIVNYNEDNSIVIYNTARGGDYYSEFTEDEYNLFMEEGWSKGLNTMALDRYTSRLKLIESKIKTEVNGRNNTKYLDFLKTTRKETLNKYYKVTQKFNKNDKSTKNN